MTEELPTTSSAYRLLLQEERHHNISKLLGQNAEPMAFTVDKGCYERGYGTTWTENTQRGFHQHRNKRVNNNTYYFDHYNMKGHTMDRCYKLHGYPNKNRPHNKKIVAPADSDLIEKEDIASTSLSMGQLNHLCALLGKKDSS